MSETINLSVKGMSCQHCVGRVDKALAEVPGVDSVKVILEGGRARVEGAGLDLQALIEAVTEAGYEAAAE